MDDETTIFLSQRITTATATKGEWQITWEFTNHSMRELEISSLTIPHGQFKATPVCFDPVLTVKPAGTAQFTTRVRCCEAVGLVTENAFLIFTGRWGDQPSRLFARVRVEMTESHGPCVTLESLTSQRVGISSVWAANE